MKFSNWQRLVLFLCAFANLHASDSTPQAVQNFQILLNQPTKSMHPFSDISAPSSYVQFLVNRPMVVADGTWKWHCVICKEIPTKDKGQIKISRLRQTLMETQWHLREDLKWGDGTPITGYDVKFTVDLLRKIAHEKDLQHFTYGIDDVVVDERDSKKFVIRYFGASAEFFQMENFFLLPRHLEESIWLESNEDLDEYLAESNYTKNPLQIGLYNGPYLLVSPGGFKRFQFKTNKQYYGKKPAIDPLVVTYTEGGLRDAEYILGKGLFGLVAETDLDYLSVLDLQKRIHAGRDKNPYTYQFFYKDNAIFEHISLNLRNPLLADRNIRKALMFTLDRQAIVKELFSGGKNVAQHNISPNDYQYLPPSQKYLPSPKVAERILELAGWTYKEKQAVRSKDDQQLTLTITIPEKQPLRKQIAEIIKKQLAPVGIGIEIEELDGSDFYQKAVARAQFKDLILFAWHSSSDKLPRATLHSREIPSFENSYSGQNIAAWRNKAVDLSLEKLSSEFNPNTRAELIEKVLTAYLEEIPEIPLFFDTAAAIVNKRLKNFQLSGNDLPSSYWAEKWKLAK